MMHAKETPHRKEGRVIPLGQKHARPLDPARRFGSRSRNRHQSCHPFVSNGQLDHKPPRRHAARPRSTNHPSKLNRIAAKENLAHMIGFKESVYYRGRGGNEAPPKDACPSVFIHAYDPKTVTRHSPTSCQRGLFAARYWPNESAQT